MRKVQRSENGLAVFNKMRKLGLQLDVVTYNSWISAREQCRMPERTLRLFVRCSSRNHGPDVVTSAE